MAERIDGKIWINRGVFVVLAYVLIVIDLLPLDMRPSLWAGPDLLLVVTLAWVARKPNYVPVLVIAAVMLMTDLLFMRPPGLWAALVVILTEAIRRQNREFRNMPLWVEWATVTFGIVAITLVNRLILAVVMAPQAPLSLTLVEMAGTIAIYPLVLAIAHFVFGVSRTAPGELGSKGQAL